jgi:hypothetical protein
VIPAGRIGVSEARAAAAARAEAYAARAGARCTSAPPIRIGHWNDVHIGATCRRGRDFTDRLLRCATTDTSGSSRGREVVPASGAVQTLHRFYGLSLSLALHDLLECS